MDNKSQTREYICGADDCGKSFTGYALRYERFKARGYNVYCSEECSEKGRKSRRIEASRRFEELRPSRSRSDRLLKIRSDPFLHEKTKEYNRNWYSMHQYGEFYDAHRTLLNLTKPMWRNK